MGCVLHLTPEASAKAASASESGGDDGGDTVAKQIARRIEQNIESHTALILYSLMSTSFLKIKQSLLTSTSSPKNCAQRLFWKATGRDLC